MDSFYFNCIYSLIYDTWRRISIWMEAYIFKIRFLKRCSKLYDITLNLTKEKERFHTGQSRAGVLAEAASVFPCLSTSGLYICNTSASECVGSILSTPTPCDKKNGWWASSYQLVFKKMEDTTLLTLIPRYWRRILIDLMSWPPLGPMPVTREKRTAVNGGWVAHPSFP